jgi:hypothetical protein
MVNGRNKTKNKNSSVNISRRFLQENGIKSTEISKIISGTSCFALSPRRPYGEYKRMVLEHTHGLFIT